MLYFLLKRIKINSMKKILIFLGAHCISPKFTILRLNSGLPCKGEKWREIALSRHFNTRCLKTLHKNIFVKKWACAVVFLMILFLIHTLPVSADDGSDSFGGIGDSMKDTGAVENAFNGQKQITDEEFQKTIDQLKAKHHLFDASNASYLIHLYEEKGIDFLQELNGRFSGILVDVQAGKVLLFNDRYGMQRIYFYENRDAFYFSSEAK